MCSGNSLLGATVALLFLSGAALAQTNPGFVDGAPLCANYPNTVCQDTSPRNPMSLNQAFMNKMDVITSMVGDGITDNSAAFQALLTPIGMGGGSVSLPCGNFVINRQTSLVIGAGRNVTVEGKGLCTTLMFQGTNATSINLSNPFSAIRWGNMRLTTDSPGTYIGITVSMISNPVPLTPGFQLFENMHFTGDDYTVNNPPTHYWSTALSLAGISIANINNLTVTGGGMPSNPQGTGIRIVGLPSTMAVSVIFNFSNLLATYLDTGIFYDAAYVQGVSVVSSNYQSNNYGIRVAGGGSQLSVVNSQFGDNLTAAIQADAGLGDLLVSNNLFELGGGQVGVAGAGVGFQIVGNDFLAQQAASGIGTGVSLTSANCFGHISGNIFTNLQYGISITSAATCPEVSITNNSHIGSTVTYNITGGSGIRIADTQPMSVSQLPPCNSTIYGSTMFVYDNNSTVAYYGPVTSGGIGWGRVACLSPFTGWVQN